MANKENKLPMDILIDLVKPIDINMFPGNLSVAELLMVSMHRNILDDHLSSCYLDKEQARCVTDALKFLATPTLVVESGVKAEQTIARLNLQLVRKMAIEKPESLGVYVGLEGEGNISREIIEKLFGKPETIKQSL